MKSEAKFLAVPVGSIAVFLIFASLVMVWYPISSPLRDYLFGGDQDHSPGSVYLRDDKAIVQGSAGKDLKDTVVKELPSQSDGPEQVAKNTALESNTSEGLRSAPKSDNLIITQPVELTDSPSSVKSNHVGKMDSGKSADDLATSTIKSSAVPPPSPSSGNLRKVGSGGSRNAESVWKGPSARWLTMSLLIRLTIQGVGGILDNCDLYHGKWVYDSAGPVYTNNTCPIITQMQNCQGNGRPDNDYENWRWQPEHCNLPRFDAHKFLHLMASKTIALIGDSVARNQMESLLCMLWKVETPKNRGSRQMHRWYFRSTSTTIIRMWSSWLVHTSNDPFPSVPDNVVKVYLDLPDETFMDKLPKFDVVVLSSGHWFAKQSAYILNNTIVGGQLWTPKEVGQRQVNNMEAFGISVETSLMAIASHPLFTGLAIVRSFSPDHYEGGAWNTGGSCTGKVSPVTQVVRNGFTDSMHEKQVSGFQQAAKKAADNSKLILMDITEPFGYRPDGHPGPYRSPDPNKITKRGPNGEPPPQDCLHWCMPGPIDTWNEILLEIIRRELEHN